MKNSKNILLWGFILSTAIFIAWIYSIYFPSLDVQDSRYLLSALAQSQAAIIGILVTLSAIVIQIFSQKYGFRSVKDFLLDLRILSPVFFYFLSISYDLTVLGILNLSPQNEVRLFYFSLFGIVLFVAAFAFLIYFIVTLNSILNPENIIGKHMERAEKNFGDMVRQISETEKLGVYNLALTTRRSVFSPIIDVIKTSIKNDPVTANFGIKEIENIYKKIVQKMNDFNAEKLIPSARLGEYDEDKETFLLELILQDFTINLLDVYKEALNRKDQSTINSVIESITEIHILNRDTLQRYPYYIPNLSLEIFHKKLLLEELMTSVRTNVESLIKIGDELMEHDLNREVSHLVAYLPDIIETTKEEKFLDVQRQITDFLNRTMEYGSRIDDINLVLNSAEHTQEEMELFLERYHPVSYARHTLESVEKSAKNLIDVEVKGRYIREFFEKTLDYFGEYAACKIFDNLLDFTTRVHRSVALHAIENDFSPGLRAVVESLATIGEDVCKTGGVNIDRVFDVYDNILDEVEVIGEYNVKDDIMRNIERFVAKLADTHLNQREENEDCRYHFDFVPDALALLFRNDKFGKVALNSFRRYDPNPFGLMSAMSKENKKKELAEILEDKGHTVSEKSKKELQSMTKEEIQDYAKDFYGKEVSTNQLKREMIQKILDLRKSNK